MIIFLLGVLVFMTAVMLAGWAFQRQARNGGWTDVFWTFGTGAAGVACALIPSDHAQPWRQAAVALLVAIWSLRLGFYVALRVARSPEDARYASLRQLWGAAFQKQMFWLLIVQAPATTLLCIAILLAARQPAPGFRPADALGLAILVVAIAGESLADAQMKHFKADPTNHGKVCDKGLWGWSRHPNYFFEWFGWLAYPAIAIDLGPGRWWSWLSLIGPAFMYLILTRFTGVPPLEAAMLKSRGQGYRDYQQRVSRFLLRPPHPRPDASPGSPA